MNVLLSCTDTLSMVYIDLFFRWHVRRVCSLCWHTPWQVAACRLLQSGNGRSVDKCIFKNFPPLCQVHAFSWKRVVHIYSIRLAINQPIAKTHGSCCNYSACSNRSQYRRRRQPPRLNRSNLSYSFRLGHQLQARICKCKCQSIHLPNHLSSTLAA